MKYQGDVADMLAVVNTIQNTFPPRRMAPPGGDRPRMHTTATRLAGAKPALPSDKIRLLATTLCEISRPEYDDLDRWVTMEHCVARAQETISANVQ